MKIIRDVKLCKENRKEILKNISETPLWDKDRILSFLNNGEDWGVRCSTVYDYIKNESTHKSTYVYKSDSFAWNDEDIYHFEKYNLKLSDEFLEYAREKIKQSENQAL